MLLLQQDYLQKSKALLESNRNASMESWTRISRGTSSDSFSKCYIRNRPSILPISEDLKPTYCFLSLGNTQLAETLRLLSKSIMKTAESSKAIEKPVPGTHSSSP